MKKKIGVLTATRAEFGLLKPLILRLREEDCFKTDVLVTGMHLSEAFGFTYKEIEEAGIPAAVKIECISEGDTPADVSAGMAMALSRFGKYFAEESYDLLIVLGDRYETMAVCIAAMNAGVPIAHIHGGETTEGAVDEAIRHSITKMSSLHFTAAEVYRKRVIQMGESPERVFNVGALAIENIKHTDFMDRYTLGDELGMDPEKMYGVVTYHPVTLKENSGVEGIDQLTEALDAFPEMSFIMTKANADSGGRKINQKIDDYAASRCNVVAVTSLGVRRYLSAVRNSVVVIGNSSSGIIEAPCLSVPTVNIGDRQKGRLMPDSVISCKAEKDEIIRTMKKAMSPEFHESMKNMENPYGDGMTSERIVTILKKWFEKNGRVEIEKRFYDLERV